MDEIIKLKKFKDAETITDDLILLTYGDTNNDVKDDLIGIGANKKDIFSVSFEKNQHTRTLLYKHTDSIMQIIPFCSSNSAKLSYLFTSKVNDTYHIYCKFATKEKADFIGEFTRLPMLFSYDNWNHYFLLQNENETIFLEILEESVVKHIFNLPKLHIHHSSAFIDIDGDLKPELVLVTEENDKKFVTIITKIKKDTIKVIQKFEIPNETGPLIFADFNVSGANDIAFVSKENDEYFLNILFNQRTPFQNKVKDKQKLKYDDHSKNKNLPYSLDSKNSKCHYKKNLKDFNIVEPIMNADDVVSNVATGIFLTDIKLNSYQDIILMVKNNDGKTTFMMLENRIRKESEEFFRPYDANLSDINDVISVSFADIKGDGVGGLVVNRKKDFGYKIEFYQNNAANGSYKVKALTISPQSKRGNRIRYLSGVSYKYYVEEANIVRIGSQIPQTSFLHLQTPSVLLGLGTLNYLVDKFYLGGPYSSKYNEIYCLRTKILPNSTIILKPTESGVFVELFLTFPQYVTMIIVVFILVLCVNLLVVFISFRKEKLKEKMSSRKESHLFNFAAL